MRTIFKQPPKRPLVIVPQQIHTHHQRVRSNEIVDQNGYNHNTGDEEEDYDDDDEEEEVDEGEEDMIGDGCGEKNTVHVKEKSARGKLGQMKSVCLVLLLYSCSISFS